MNRCPAVKKHLAVINFVPILDFLLPDIRRELGILAQALEIGTLDAQRHAGGIVDAICIGVEPDLFRELMTVGAGKACQFERGLYGLLGHWNLAEWLSMVLRILTK